MFSFQFETETEGSKLRRDVLAEGNIGSGGAPTAIISMLSGKEEMFAFRRAVCLFVSLYITTYIHCAHCYRTIVFGKIMASIGVF